jgi:lipopolysaccharide heptosyltransferase I
MSMKTPSKILIVKPSSLGDIVHSLPVLNALKGCYPGATIHWVVAKGLEGLLEDHPMIDKVWIINKDDWKKIDKVKTTAHELRTLFKKLKTEKYDLVIDLQGLLRSGIITASTRAPIRIGFAEAREGSTVFYTHKVRGGRNIHAVDRYLKIVEFLGCDISEIRFPLPVHEIPSPLSMPSGKYIVFIPGARWSTKKWAPEQFGELASKLPYKSVVLGSRSDSKDADILVSLSGGKALSFAGKTTFRDLITLIQNARCVVSNDSGPMHIAAALHVPVVALFGPTDPQRTGPYGNGHIIIRADVECSPCLKKRCKDMKCMKEISVERVIRNVKKVLKSS